MPALERLEAEGHVIPAEIPVARIDADTETEAAELVLLASSHHGEVTKDSLAEFAELHQVQLEQMAAMVEFQRLSIEGVARQQQGELEGAGDPDDIPEPPVGPTTKTGDLWVMGAHRMVCGDARDLVDAVAASGGGMAKLVLTDPPYGVNYIGKTADALRIANDDLDEAGLEDLVRRAFDVAEAVSEAGSYWYATVPAGPLHLIFAADWKRRGILRQIMVWVKDRFVLGHSEYHYRHEPILYGYKPGDGRWGRGGKGWYGDNAQGSVFEVARPKASPEHPTSKPIDLIVRCLQNSSRKGAVVYDPFSGSGSTTIACEQLGRQCYSVEIDPVYCDVVVQRWQGFAGKRAEGWRGNG